MAGGTYDHELLRMVPSIEPFVPLSPQLQIVAESCAAVQDLVDGNFLRACERWRERADELLKLILKRLRIDQGVLYIAQHGSVSLSAVRGDLPSGLDELMERFLSAQIRASTEHTTALAGSLGGEQKQDDPAFRHAEQIYRPLVLVSYHQEKECITGAVIVCGKPGVKLSVPHDVLETASDALIEAGDVISHAW